MKSKIPKTHVKKKAYQSFCKKMAQDGFINDADGRFIKRPSGGNAMMRDYYPQSAA